MRTILCPVCDGNKARHCKLCGGQRIYQNQTNSYDQKADRSTSWHTRINHAAQSAAAACINQNGWAAGTATMTCTVQAHATRTEHRHIRPYTLADMGGRKQRDTGQIVHTAGAEQIRMECY